MDNLITQEQAIKDNSATLKKLLGLSLADLTKLQELHQRKYEEHRNQIDYMVNKKDIIDLKEAREKLKEYETVTLIIREAADIRYNNIFKDKVNISYT